MRPGRLNPGKHTLPPTRPIRGHSFNEAGAIKPRKGRKLKPAPTTARRFNEAGAIKPRKEPTALLISDAQDAASMRPGRLNPGKGGE